MRPLEIKTYPEPCLRITTKPVEDFNDDLRNILKEMADIMHVSNGIGLAGTQVGLGASMLVADIGEGLNVLINPEIVEVSDRRTGIEEGCLSLPGVTVEVARPETVKISARNEHGEPFIKRYDGLMAKVVQHEIDHLSGRLLIDYLNPLQHFIAARKLARIKRKNEFILKGEGLKC